MNKKEALRKKRHQRIKLKISGSAQRPRVVIFRSVNHLVAQFVDDISQKTLFSVSTNDKDVRQKIPTGGNIKSAQLLGEICGQKAKEKGVTQVVFDRAGHIYHGRIKAFAESLRKAGLQF